MKKESDKNIVNKINITVDKEKYMYENYFRPVSPELAKELDLAIAESNDPKSKTYTLEEIWESFKKRHNIKYEQDKVHI